MQTTRTFLAVDLTREVRRNIEAYMQSIRTCFPERTVGWTNSHNLHLTLKFYGDLNHAALEKLKTILAGIGREVAPFSFQVTGSGVFPNPSRARILWIGISPCPQLAELARTIDARSPEVGVECEQRPFSAHLTIGRIRDGISSTDLTSGVKSFLEKPARSLGTVPVDHMLLMRSELLPTGAVYSSLADFPFRKSTE